MTGSGRPEEHPGAVPPNPRRPRRATGGKPTPDDVAAAGAGALPAPSVDDSDVGWGDRGDSTDNDEQLLRDVPPHW